MDTSLLFLGDEMGHLVKRSNFYSSALNEAIIIGFIFSLFPSWAREEIPNCLILYVSENKAHRFPLMIRCSVGDIRFPKASVLLNSFPMRSKRFCKEFLIHSGKWK